jgi:hypothetical protein
MLSLRLRLRWGQHDNRRNVTSLSNTPQPEENTISVCKKWKCAMFEKGKKAAETIPLPG